MKKSLFLYLFIIAVLMNLFTYMYYSKRINFEENQFKTKNTRLKDSLALLTDKMVEANYFSLENNQNAQNYFDNANSDKYIPYEKVIPFVTEKLLDYNSNPKGNPYTGQDQIGAQKFVINKVKIINHRWIIADFSDGEYWGEVLLKYFIDDKETVSFEEIQSVIYAK